MSLDPYHVSQATLDARETARLESIEATISAYGSDISGVLEDLEKSLKADGAELVSVTVDVGNLGVEIKVK